MDYDPVKDRLGRVFSQAAPLQRLFYGLLHLFFLRAWYVKREVRQVLGQRPAGEPIRVLDAGTGFGQYAYYIVRTFPRAIVHAVDVKQDYLANARRFLDQTPYGPRVTTAYDDLTDLRAEGPFDFILSVDVMEHIEADRTVFQHFARVLRPGGHVLINTPSDLGGSDVDQNDGESFIGEHVRDGYNLRELEGKLRDAGLEPVRSLYTYGPYGSLAWRMLIKRPIQWLDRSWLSAFLLPLYYLPVLPIGMALHALDLRRPNAQGTGVLVVAQKVKDPGTAG
ncbi:MAG: class I SAM-dependent methyltransferase [Bacteroidota bacterium]